MENYTRIISVSGVDPTIKSTIIPEEWKKDIDQMLVIDYMAANRYYAENNPDLVKEIAILTVADPSEFYDGLVNAWFAHHAFFEAELEPIIGKYINIDEEELSSRDISLLIDLYSRTVEIDSNTLSYSAAIKPNIAYNVELLASKYGYSAEEFVSKYLRTETFFSYYTSKNLRYIVELDEGLDPEPSILASEFHAGDKIIMEARLSELRSKYDRVPLEKLMNRLNASVSEPSRPDYISIEDWEKITSIRKTLLFDNLEEYMIANNLEGVSGYILRRKISKLLVNAELLDNRPRIYDYDNDEILYGLEALMQLRIEDFEKRVEPKRQSGLTCSAACATMVESYVFGTPPNDKVEALYAAKSNSKYIEGQHYSLLAAEMDRRGIKVSLVHEEQKLFKQEGIDETFFKLLMEEYSEGLKQCILQGVPEERGVKINPEYILERIKEGKIVMLAGQILKSSILHSVLITGIDKYDNFIVIDPLNGRREVWPASKVELFSDTNIGKWLMVIDTEASLKAYKKP